MALLRLWNQDKVPVGKIIGLLRNYRKHAEEMGAPVPPAPTFFLKPATSLLGDGGTVILPSQSERVDHEVELAVVVGRTVRDVPAARWKDAVLGYAVCLDLTARDLQDAAKRGGEPWALAKGFDTFFPMSHVVDKAQVSDPQGLELQLFVNGDLRQRGHTRDMVVPVSRAVEYLSSVMTLERGDVIATGTPEGVGPIARGDALEARIPGVVSLKVRVDKPAR